MLVFWQLLYIRSEQHCKIQPTKSLQLSLRIKNSLIQCLKQLCCHFKAANLQLALCNQWWRVDKVVIPTTYHIAPNFCCIFSWFSWIMQQSWKLPSQKTPCSTLKYRSWHFKIMKRWITKDHKKNSTTEIWSYTVPYPPLWFLWSIHMHWDIYMPSVFSSATNQDYRKITRGSGL